VQERAGAVVESRVVASVEPSALSPRQVGQEFCSLLEAGAKLEPAGAARRRPRVLLERYPPRHKIELLDVTYYLSDARQNADIRFFVAYVVRGLRARARRIHPRLFYKDISLTWRSASHHVRSEEENWIGKGDVKTVVEDGEELVVSNELTTDLPLEIQTALETCLRRARRVPRDEVAVGLVLRRGPDDRIEPYRDFTGPRRRAAANPRNRVNRGRPIARFTRKNDPASLRFARGYEPDFADGVVEAGEGTSRLYGGRLRRFRIVSRNRKVQYLFIAGPHQAWIASCQPTTTEIMSYGVRTLDVAVDDDLLLPGYEYHYLDESEDPPALHSQIPPGFAGAVSDVDPSRADASPWLDRVPVIREFRRKVLGRASRDRLSAPSSASTVGSCRDRPATRGTRRRPGAR